MAIDQFNNMLTVAAALSMAGWVARSPEYMPDHQPFNADNREDIDYFGHQQQFWQNDNQEISSPLVQSMTVPYDINENFHESKFISDFTPINEVQDLVSWQEAYRRGDLSFGSTSNYAYPLVTFEDNNEYLYSQLQHIPDNYDDPYSSNHDDHYNDMLLRELHQDDGYGSGDVGSPETSDMSSLLSLNLDSISSQNSPLPNLLDLNDIGVEDLLNTELINQVQPSVNEPVQRSVNDPGIDPGIDELQGAVGYSHNDPDFDIEQLFADDYFDLYDAFPHTEEEPSDTARSRVNSLEYASPLIDPHLNEYLGTFIGPDQQNNLDTSFDDPFRMQFTEQALPDSKFVSEVLTEFDYLPYGATVDGDLPYEKDLDNNIADDEIESLSGIEGASQNSYAGPSSEDVYSPKSNIPLPDHDYAKEFKEEEQMDTPTRNAVDALASNFYKNHKDTVDEKSSGPLLPTPLSRTFAPSSHRTSTSSKKNIVSPDLPYTREELINMDIDDFNKHISRVDDMTQLVLKDMRKKGKNKFAARNCRKRKLDVIDNLDNNVELLEKQKELLLHEQQLLLEETRQIHEKTVSLNNYILQHLSDESGNPYSDSYTLEYTTDGNVYLIPYLVKTEGKVAQDV